MKMEGGGERRFKGIRMRKWGKWVAEIREPNKRSRIWLGSYSSPVAAARAYDTAVFYLRGPSGRLNFPELLAGEWASGDLSAASIRKRATEVGARVDAMETVVGGRRNRRPTAAEGGSAAGGGFGSGGGFSGRVDLNKVPEPETAEDGW